MTRSFLNIVWEYSLGPCGTRNPSPKGHQPLTLDVTLLPGQTRTITGSLGNMQSQRLTVGLEGVSGSSAVNENNARHDVKAARQLVRQRPGARPSGLTAAQWQQVLTAAQQQAQAQKAARQTARTNALLFALAAQNVGQSIAARRQPRTVVRPSSSLAVPAPNVLAPSVPAASPALSLSSAGYLGRLSVNRFLPDSTANRVGRYGSRYSPQSVTNPYGRFGSAYASGSASNPYTFNAPRVVADDGTYLGKLSANPYDPHSVSNPYGRFGSRYSPTSINNPYGRYGSRYSPLSPTNPYAVRPPLILPPEP